jgi:hypothetical protein
VSFIQNFYTSRDNNTDGNTYVGQEGRLWYNPDTNSIYVNAANVAGGTPVALATGANIVATNLTVSTITSPSGTVALTGNITITGNISPAATNKIGGISPGPGVNVSNVGLLTIDSAGLPISFGDFYANVNQLSMVNANEPMYLVSNGTGNINLIGGVNFFKPDGFPPNEEPFFRAKNDGQIRILVPVEDPVEGGVEIIGSATGNYIAPGQPGTMLQLTGNPNISARFYMDSIGQYASFVGRRYNGNVASPTQVLADEDVLRINATAATDAGVGNVAMAQISFHALENQTTTAQGSRIDFTVTPVGSPASARVDVANISVANGVSATKFTTAGNVTATGNITTANTFIGNLQGLVTQRVRNAGTIADGGTLTIDFATDDLVYCTWNNSLTIAGSNYTAGRVVKVMATKGTGSGTDAITFSGFTASHISTGSTSQSYSADVTAIIDFISTTALVGGVYIKI